MLNGHGIKLPNKAKSLSQQVSAALRLIREVCVVHSGERKNSQPVKEQRLSVYGVSSNKWDIFYHILFLQGSGNTTDEGGGKTESQRSERTSVNQLFLTRQDWCCTQELSAAVPTWTRPAQEQYSQQSSMKEEDLMSLCCA